MTSCWLLLDIYPVLVTVNEVPLVERNPGPRFIKSLKAGPGLERSSAGISLGSKKDDLKGLGKFTIRVNDENSYF